MSLPQEPKPGKLVIGLFMKDKSLFEPIVAELTSAFGALDVVSSWIPFDYTSYYEPEMGTPLFRRLLSFKDLIHQAIGGHFDACQFVLVDHLYFSCDKSGCV